ncbi:MAG TPA: fasciclin domain-containing protein [Pyrinomonadaceae bacterium]|nr:fasciclin domain-containing protein [Pyrinomonadaceae bacterium]
MKEKYDVIETANQAGNFRVFLQALETAGLKQTLKDAGPYTIFAPVDDAFAKMPKAKVEGLFKTENKESLQSLLRNHVIAGKLLTADLKGRDETRSMKGEALKIDDRAGLYVNQAQVITPDLKASNGVLHGIDTVLMPQAQAAAAS